MIVETIVMGCSAVAMVQWRHQALMGLILMWIFHFLMEVTNLFTDSCGTVMS